MQTGIVKFFIEQKGFGFIKDSDSDAEYFVHMTGLVNKIKQNDQVSFDLTEGKKGGMQAINVRLIGTE